MKLLPVLRENLQKVFIAALALSTAALPLHKTISNILLIATAAVGLIIYIDKRKFNAVLGIIPMTMLVFYVFTILYSDNLKFAIHSQELGATLLFVPLIFGFGAHLITEKIGDNLLKLFAVIVMLMCVFTYLKTVIITGVKLPSMQSEGYTYHDYLSRYEFAKFLNFHPTYLSIFLLFATVIFWEKFKIGFVFKLLILMVSAFFQVILSSKNQMIVFVPIAAILMWRHVQIDVRLKSGIVVVVIGLILLLAFKSDQVRYRFESEISSTAGQRSMLWQVGWNLSKEHALIGTGIGDGQDAIDVATIEKGYPELLGFNMHNQFLDYAIYFGIPGLAVFCCILLLPYFYKTDVTFLLFMFIIISSCATESILLRQKGICLFTLFYGLLGSRYYLWGGKDKTGQIVS